MKTCENCNAEHDGSYGSGRFCSSKCARGFSTKAKRKEINEKVAKKLADRGHGDVLLTCKNCNKEFKRPWNKRDQKTCSNTCRALLRGKKTVVERGNLWDIYGFIKGDQYLLAIVPTHPKRLLNLYYPYHRVVMENHLGRLLTEEEIVHHINEDKRDNRLENLAIVSKAEHNKIHLTK